jgi:hypothetical protein
MIAKDSGGQFEQAPAGAYMARCYKLVDLGTQITRFQDETKAARKVVISFELSGERMTGKYHPDSKGRLFSVQKWYTLSLGSKANLRADLESWRGRKFTDEERAGFALKKLLGAPCMLNLVQDGEYTNIAAISAVPKGTVVPKQENQSVYFSLEKDEFDAGVLKSLPEKTQEKIKASPEYQHLVNPEPDERDDAGSEEGRPDDADESSSVPF